jgi:ATP-dependent RNA helicase DDX35
VIVATTIAETSVTLEGIVYVIDSCFVKLAFFNPLTGIESLITTLISKAAAKQRAGRAGRLQAGKCFRLCTEHFYQTFLKKDTIPQIQRTNLSRIVLYLLSMGIQNLAHFDFISPPSAEALIRGLELLYSLGVINEKNELIEPLGTQIAEFPVEPTLARMLLASFEYECTCAILSIASILCVGDIFQNSTRNSKEKKQNISDAIQLFAHPLGDHLTYLKVYTSFLENQKSKQWCEENYINYRAMKRAVEIRKQLKRYVKRFAIDSNKTLKKDFEHNNNNNNKEEEEEESHLILQCILTGFFANAAKLDPTGTYRTVRDNRAVQIHPSSVYAFFGNVPEYITYHQSVLSSEEYIRDISKIDPRWLLQIAPDFYQSKELSSKISGSSGTLGLPKNTSRMMQPQNKKQQQQQTSTSETGGRILFRKPTATTAATNKTTKSKLPVHIGKSKGGLRSQF